MNIILLLETYLILDKNPPHISALDNEIYLIKLLSPKSTFITTPSIHPHLLKWFYLQLIDTGVIQTLRMQSSNDDMNIYEAYGFRSSFFSSKKSV